MAKKAKKKRIKKSAVSGHWSTPRNFILAASGAVIGLNNIWQFPYIAGQNGGGLFLIAYLLGVLLVAVPIFMAEVTVGRLGKGSPIQSMRHLINRVNGDPNWLLLGTLKTFTGIVVLSFLSVIGGWAIAYTVRASLGTFDGLTSDGVNSVFTQFVSDPEKQIFWHTFFIVMTMVVVARGLKRGFEPVTRYVVPAFFFVLAVLLLYALTLDQFPRAVFQMLAPDPASFSVDSLFLAIGHGFFSLGLGFGAILVYSAYMPTKASIPKVTLSVVGLDTVAGLAAGIAIYSVLFSGQQETLSGPALMFQSLPLALDVLPNGQIALTLFYLLLVLAAWMTAIALIEPAMTWLVESHDMDRFHGAIWCGIAVWLLGLVMIFSFNVWAFKFQYFGIEKHLGLFDFMQILISNFLLPTAGILMALFVGWSLNKSVIKDAIKFKSDRTYRMWLWGIRLVSPALLLITAFFIPRLFL